MRLKDKVIIITGATSGIGRAIAIRAIADAAILAFGQIDGLVNNAAIIERNNLSQLTPEAFSKTIAINLQSALFLIQACYEHLKKSKGAVLNIGSINAYSGESSLLAYSIGKAGLQTMTRNLANAHGVDQVRFNLINVMSPGHLLAQLLS